MDEKTTMLLLLCAVAGAAGGLGFQTFKALGDLLFGNVRRQSGPTTAIAAGALAGLFVFGSLPVAEYFSEAVAPKQATLKESRKAASDKQLSIYIPSEPTP